MSRAIAEEEIAQSLVRRVASAGRALYGFAESVFLTGSATSNAEIVRSTKHAERNATKGATETRSTVRTSVRRAAFAREDSFGFTENACPRTVAMNVLAKTRFSLIVEIVAWRHARCRENHATRAVRRVASANRALSEFTGSASRTTCAINAMASMNSIRNAAVTVASRVRAANIVLPSVRRAASANPDSLV